MDIRNRKLAYTDWQLDLPNGLQLVRDLSKNEATPSLIIFEVSSLREINEVCGRHMGDQLLLDMRNYFRENENNIHEFYRISGNKFCITIFNISPEDLHTYAINLSNRLVGPWNVKSNHNFFNVSCETIMAIILPEYVQQDESLLNVIERTFKAAKEIEKKILVYDEVLDKMFKRRRQFEFSLKRCVANNMEGFTVFYQPIANPVTGTWCGLEALCRWISPELGFVSPIEFIAESERLDLIDTIGLWVLETAIRQCKAWELDKQRIFMLDVNVSAVQLADAALADKILNLLALYDFPGNKLCLEITESTQFTFSGSSMNTFEKLRSNKISIALDDFGTGYSTFNKLKEMPVDIVKIERVFVMDIENDSYLRYLFRAIAELVHTADMRLVAEGVETQGQMNILLKNGADLLQGYLFSKPLDANELSQKLHYFFESDLQYNFMQQQKVDMSSILRAESNYTLTPSLNRTMFRCIHVLLRDDNVDHAIHEVLGIVGKTLDVSRACVFEYDDDELTCTNTYEWCTIGVESYKNNLYHVPIPETWMDIMRLENIISSSDISHLTPQIYESLEQQGIKSIMAIPLWEKTKIIGSISLVDCLNYRAWWPEEILILYNICLIIASVMNRIKK